MHGSAPAAGQTPAALAAPPDERPRAPARRNGARLGVACFPPTLDWNPYLRLLYGALARHGVTQAADARFRARWLAGARGRVRTLHLHWPEGLYRYCGARGGPAARVLSLCKLGAFAARLAAARALGYRIVWTVHQVLPHDRRTPLQDRAAALLLGRAAHLLLAHDEATAEEARRRLRVPRRRIAVVPHGSYLGVYPPGRSRTEVREELGLAPDEFAFLCFGELRGDKDLGLLLEAFSPPPAGAALVVAGHPKDAEAARRVAAAGPHVRPLLRFVPPEEVAGLHGACDAAVLPRTDGRTSGALLLSLSLGLPVVAADRPAYRELVGPAGAGWLFEPGSVESLRAALHEAAADPAEAARRGAAALTVARGRPWDAIAARTATLLAGDG